MSHMTTKERAAGGMAFKERLEQRHINVGRLKVTACEYTCLSRLLVSEVNEHLAQFRCFNDRISNRHKTVDVR